MNDDKKIFFYIGILVLFVASFCWFNTSHIDERRSEDIGARISDSQDLNRELQAGVENSKAKVVGTVERLGTAEAELDRASRAIAKCQQILRTAEQRTQETNPQDK